MWWVELKLRMSVLDFEGVTSYQPVTFPGIAYSVVPGKGREGKLQHQLKIVLRKENRGAGLRWVDRGVTKDLGSTRDMYKTIGIGKEP